MKLGDIHYKLKEFPASLNYYEKAEAYLLKQHGEHHPMTLDCLKSIGNIYLQIDELEKANKNFNQALKICQTIFGEKNVQTGETYRQIGDLYNKKGQSKGIQYYEKAKSIYEYLYGPDNVHIAVIYNNIGGLYERLQEYDKAEELCLKALKIKQSLHGQESLDLANIY